MKTKYTNKQIWMIAYPILISLLMEQMIGMTDTAFLGRVGEVELGASAIAGVFYMVIFMVAFGFSIGAQILIARRNGEQQYKEIGNLFYQGIYFQIGLAAVIFSLDSETYRSIGSYLRSSHQLFELARIRSFFLIQWSHVPRLFPRYNADQDADAELCSNGIEQRSIQLYTNLR
mgnify:CR=1 FL=1